LDPQFFRYFVHRALNLIGSKIDPNFVVHCTYTTHKLNKNSRIAWIQIWNLYKLQNHFQKSIFICAL